MTIMQIKIEDELLKKETISHENLGFGRYFTNRMFSQRYTENKKWHCPKISDLKPLELPPHIQVFHSGQNVFEGIKAYYSKNGDINIFRLSDHLERFNRSAQRLAMPEIPIERHKKAICKLVETERDWIPKKTGCALYIRPVMIGVEPTLEVRAAKDFLHFIILSPVGPYFGEPLSPVSVWISDDQVRAIKGGTGTAKTAANYAGSIFASEKARANSYDQVLWLDGIERRYIEELSGMNIMFVTERQELITPLLNGSILEGITRASIIELAPKIGLSVREEKIDVYQMIAEISSKKIIEAFAIGTGATIAPVGRFGFKGRDTLVNGGSAGPIAKLLYKNLTDIQHGRAKDFSGWLTTI